MRAPKTRTVLRQRPQTPMNPLRFIVATTRRAYLALGRHADHHEQQAIETHLHKAKSAAELERLERQWMRARH